MKYRKKPVVIEAFQLNERGLVEEDWFWDAVSENKIITHNFGKFNVNPAWCEIRTLEGTMTAKAGDYIIKGIAGELYPCKPDIFEKTYAPATLTPQNEWVSVEENLPDAEEEVRLCCVTALGHRYQCQGFYVPPGTYQDDSGYSWDWECCEEYDEERDDYLVNPGWYESIHNWDEYSACGITDKVTHWMPLPAPPDRRPPERQEDPTC